MSKSESETKNTKLYVECGRCGQRWAVLELPARMEPLGRALRSARCPNCDDARKLYVCATDGPYAVIEPRQGRRVRRKGGAK